MPQRFAGRRALVTGGSRGIGRAVAQQLAREGAGVAIVGRHPQDVAAAVHHLKTLSSGPVIGITAIIGDDPARHETILRQAWEQLGAVDVLVNAAGGAWVAATLEIPWERWQQEMATKFWGYFGMMRAVLERWQENQQPGVIVNLVGVAGKDPNPRLAVGSVINAALRALVKNLATDVAGQGIRIVNVNPGATETDLLTEMAIAYAKLRQTSVEEALAWLRTSNPCLRLPRAEEVAELVAFLASDGAAMITGTAIDIDGGAHHGLA